MISGRVLDVGFGIASAYAGKLFEGAGFEVIKLEPVGGDPLRGHTASMQEMANDETGVLFDFLNQSKKFEVVPDWPELSSDLLSGASILISSFLPDELDVDATLKKYPELIVVSITPYGRQGPYANRVATEFTLQAESGALGMRALPQDPPVRAGGQIVEWAGGTIAAVAGLGAYYGLKTGAGKSSNGSDDAFRHIDLSLCEVGHLICSNYADLSYSLSGRPLITQPNRATEMPEIHPTLDGFVGFTANSRQQFVDFLVLIERVDWLEDEQLLSYAGRRQRREEFTAAVNEWTGRHTTQEVLEKAAAFRLPCAPVSNGKTLLENDHLKQRGVFSSNGRYIQPRRPWIQHELKTNTGDLNIKSPKKEPSIKSLPLEGLLVVDMTAWWAGPSAAQVLATLGADVIHVESCKKPDGIRMTGGLFASEYEDWWERSMFFLHANINKRDLTLDLSTEVGLRIIKELITKADLILENFTPRVMENFGLDFEGLRKLNPAIVTVRMPAFGLTGPWRDYPGFAQTMEQMSGMAWLTGHVHDQPRNQRGPSDPNAGMHAAFVALVGLLTEPSDLEVPMIESAINASVELVLEYSAYGHIMEREGNRSSYAAPQNVYECMGEDNWLAISVTTDEQWQSFKDALGNPAWANSQAFESFAGRKENEDEIDAEISKWGSTQDVDQAVELLSKSGVPVGKVRDARLLTEHPQLIARNYYEEVEHPAVGKHPIPSLPFKMSGVDKWIRMPAPTLGQHSEEILGELGYNSDEISDLKDSGVTGNRPAF